MSIAIIGLALGLASHSPTAGFEMNPHMLAADRAYQELIFEARRLIVEARTEQRLTEMQRQRARTIRADGRVKSQGAEGR